MKIELKVNEHSAKLVRDRLKKMTKVVKDTRAVNIRVGVWLLRWINDNFRSKGGKVGGWDELKAGGRWIGGRKSFGILGITLRKGRKRKFDSSAKPLQDTGRLRASFDYKATRTNVFVGSNIKYSYPHEHGFKAGHIPQRRMLPRATDKDVETGILKIYDIYIKRATEK